MTPLSYAIGGALLAATLLAPVAHRSLEADVFAGTDDRKSSRVFYYERNEDGFQPLGQFSIDFGTPKWKAEYELEGGLDQYKGKRWRFGSGMWTTLDSNIPLAIAEHRVEPGCYYCAIEYTEMGEAHLVLLDPTVIRKAKLDASQVGDTKYGISIPLEWTSDNDKVEVFTIALEPEETDKTQVLLRVQWGPHQLTTSIEAHLD